ncbi:MAG: sigma 54-interacting transcriptional regulator [Pseudomonadales bacterium]|nr:sigma 54-interacting transcriptional regulator [Pseudomonadales bacterium]
MQSGEAFFRDVTVDICRHLQIEDSLQACAALLATHMPVERMYLDVWDRETGTVRTIATATPTGAQALDRLVNYPQMRRRQPIDTLVDEQQELNVFFNNDAIKPPWFVAALQAFGRPVDRAIIGTYPMLDGQVTGAVVAIAPAGEVYTERHAALFAFLKSPFGIAIQNALRYRQLTELSQTLADDNRFFQRELRGETTNEIIGSEFGLADTLWAARQVAVHDSPVLLTGETGVGKDVIANHIHQVSNRSRGPFIKVNCGAIPESLLDSELFGHEKGAFTGAIARKRGRFERAHGGTIFLDEIGELTPQAQVRLLRVLQHKEFERVGGDGSLEVDVRVIAATHRNLEEMVRRGEFREDLWFRLNVFPLLIPPLRARKEDIPALVQHFVKIRSSALRYAQAPAIDVNTLRLLSAYRWPGNVRELENVVERALILGGGRRLAIEGLLPVTQAGAESDARLKPAENVSPISEVPDPAGFKTLDEIAAGHIEQVLQFTGGKIHGKGGAADLLAIKPGTLRSRMDKLGIQYRRINTRGN